MVHIAIIEDEPAAARELAFVLQELDPSIQILDTMGSIAEASSWLEVNHTRCDLIFMDIQLADGLSFEIFERVNIDTPVIFVTAYDEYALNAFKKNGIDYILKPYDTQEIATALQKYKKWQGKLALPSTIFEQMSHLLQGEAAYKNAFLVHHRNKLIPIQTKDIAWFYTENEIVYARTKQNEQYVIEHTLDKLQHMLNPGLFFRANRQFIIQKSSVQDAEVYFNNRLLVNLNPPPEEKLIMSRARIAEFKSWMNT